MDNDDYETILLLARGCSLDSSPKKNWVERSGGLPNYICRIARAIMRSGKPKSRAIAIAVSRVKKWAAGGDDVDADTRAKAAKAVAQWTALKAKNKAKKVISASYITSDGEEDTYLILSNIPSYKTDIVRMAWDAKQRELRAQEKMYRSDDSSVTTEVPDFSDHWWIKELWTDFILVENEVAGQPELRKVPFTVHPLTHAVTFGEPQEVKQVYIEIDEDLTEEEEELLEDLLD